MIDSIVKTNRIYLSTFSLVVYFSVFILFSLVLMPLVSSFVNVGGAFLRFSSFYLDLTPAFFLIFILVGLISLLSLSFFISAIVSIVKLRETLDHVKFSKAVSAFPKYVAKVFTFFLMLSSISIAAGILLSFLGIHSFIIQLALFVLWIPFVFTPQVIIIEDLGVFESMKDAWKFAKKSPHALLSYFLVGFIILFVLIVVETVLGQFFVWEHKLISVILLSMFVVPYLQMFATELYIRRYAVSRL